MLNSCARMIASPKRGCHKAVRASGANRTSRNHDINSTTVDRRSVLRLHTGGFLATFGGSLVWPDVTFSRDAGDWSTPGLASNEDPDAPKFVKSASGVVTQELIRGTGERDAMPGDSVLVDFVVRRANGYFIYSTVEGLSFQPRDIPTGPVKWTLKDDKLLPGLVEGLTGLKRGGRRRILVPPSMGYMSSEGTSLEPKMPTFGTSRQLGNHKSEPLIFEVEMINIQ